ncbi:MAG: hypothetical protein MZU95_00610 [Desulfomicrobium escambiense]|nr:hypothetical protein [Desulfomicrobium escambiense]
METLSKLVLQSRLFPARHPSVERALGTAFIHLDAALRGKTSIRPRIRGRRDHLLNFELDMTDTHDKAMHLFREALVRHSIGEMEFLSGVTKDEIAALAGLLAGSGPNLAGNLRLARRAYRKDMHPARISGRTARRNGDRAEAPAEPAAGPAPRIGGASGSRGAMGMARSGSSRQAREDTVERWNRARAKIIEVIERQGAAPRRFCSSTRSGNTTTTPSPIR